MIVGWILTGNAMVSNAGAETRLLSFLRRDELEQIPALCFGIARQQHKSICILSRFYE